MTKVFKLAWLGVMALISVSVFYNANFVFGDEHVFINSICRGVPCRLMAIRQTGRFYPLTHWDNNFVLLLPGLSPDHYALAMYIVNAILFAVIMLLIAKIMSYLAKSNGLCGIFGSALVFLLSLSTLPTRDFLRVFWENVFPESRLILLFVVFAWCVIKGRETDGIGYVSGAILSALIAIGYKETSFILCLVFSVTMLIWDYKGCGRRFRTMCYVLLAMGISYAIFYFGYWARGIEHSYNENRSIPLLDSIKFYMAMPMVAFSLALGLFRGARVLFFKDRNGLVYDALLFSASAVICAYIAMGITAKYYVMPVLFIVQIVVAFWLCRLFCYRRWLGMLCLLLTVLIEWLPVEYAVNYWRWSVKNRSQDMAFVRALAADKTISCIRYCRSDGPVEDYREMVFRSYFRYAGGDEKLCRSAVSFDGALATNEVAVFSFHDPEWRGKGARLRRVGRKVLGSSWYTAVYGSPATAIKKPTDINVLTLDGCDGDECFHAFYSGEATGVGRWGRGNSGLVVKIPERLRGKDLNARLDVGGTRGKRKEPNRLEVSVGGTLLAQTELGWNQVVKFTVPGALTNCAELEIGLKTAYVVCPKQEGLNSDSRELGVFFRSLSLRPAEGGGK